jgi:hypothetical protein
MRRYTAATVNRLQSGHQGIVVWFPADSTPLQSLQTDFEVHPASNQTPYCTVFILISFQMYNKVLLFTTPFTV